MTQSLNNTPSSIDPATLAKLSNEVFQSLGADRADLDLLSVLLGNEKNALEQREHEAINEYAEQKAVIVKRMEKRNELRQTLLKRNQLASDVDSWQTTIANLDAVSPVKLLPLWQEIETKLKACQRQLAINEKIIGGMKQSVDRFINILRGQTGSGQTYNATGKAENFSTTKPITSA